MGIDLATYRARIGTFVSRRNVSCGDGKHSPVNVKRKWRGKDVCKVSDRSSYLEKYVTVRIYLCFENNEKWLVVNVELVGTPRGPNEVCAQVRRFCQLIYLINEPHHCPEYMSGAAGKVVNVLTLIISMVWLRQLLILLSGDVEVNPGPLGEDPTFTLKNVLNALKDVVEWKSLGVQLDISAPKIKEIDVNNRGQVAECRYDLVQFWLESDVSCSWKKLIDALKSIGKSVLAEEIRTTYCPMYQHSPPITSNNSSAANLIPVPDDCQEALKDMYSKNNPVAPDWPPVPKFTFINLALIKDTTEQHPQKHKFYLETIRGSADDIIETKEAVDYDTLFGAIENVKPGTRILLEGRPGCGKTTLVKKLSRDWSEGKILGTVKYLFFVSLRKFYSTRIQDLNSILDTFDMQRLASDISSSFGKDICFIFDGLDEYSASFTTSGCSWFEQLLRGEKIQRSLIFITSRPNASIDLRKSVTIRAEVLGFLEQHVMEYIDRSYADDITKAGEVKAYLKEHQSIRHMCYLPLHLVMVIFLYDNRKASTPLPKTETEVYTQFTIMTLRRYYDKKGRNQKVIGLGGVPEPEAAILKKICELAYNRTAASRTDVSQYDIGVGASATEVETLGLLIVDEKDGVECSETAYSFPHLTNQEFLAAYYMSTLGPEEQLAAVKEHSVSPHMGVVLKFYCGLTKLKNVDQWKAVLDNALLQGEYSFQDKKVNLNALHCIFESQNSHRCRELFSNAEGKLAIINETLTLTDYCAIGHCLADARDVVTTITLKCQLDTEGLDIITQKLMSDELNKVKKLRIEDDLHGADKLLALKAFIVKLRFIEELCLRGCFKERGCEDWSLVEGILNECEHLKTLDFSGNSIGDVGIETFSKSVPRMSDLQHLDLEDNNIGDSGIVAFSKAAPHMSKLQHIDFSGNNIGDFGIETFSKAAPYMSNLRVLDFGANNIGCTGFEAFSKAALHMSNIQTLSFSRNNIGDVGVETFSKAAPHISNLQKLYLSSTNIGGGSIESLIKIMTSCPLKTLWLDNDDDYWANHFSASGKDTLRAVAMSLQPERVIDLVLPEENSDKESLGHPPVSPSDSRKDQHLPAVQLSSPSSSLS